MIERLKFPAIALATAATIGTSACTPEGAPIGPTTPSNPDVEECYGLPPYEVSESGVMKTASRVTCETRLFHPDTEQWSATVSPGDEFTACARDDKPLRFEISKLDSETQGIDGVANLGHAAAKQWLENRDVPLCEPIRELPPTPPEPVPTTAPLPSARA